MYGKDNNNRRIDKLHIYICLIAAAVVTAVCIFRNESLYRMSIWVTVAIVVFYIIGSLIRYYLTSVVFPLPVEEELPFEEEAFEQVEDEAEGEEIQSAEADIISEV
jgi:hypothetical protein